MNQADRDRLVALKKARDGKMTIIAVGEPVQYVEHRIAPGPVGLIAGGQIDRDIAIR